MRKLRTSLIIIGILLFCTVKILAQNAQVSPIANLNKDNTSVVNNNMQLLQTGVNNVIGDISQWFTGGILNSANGGTGINSSAIVSGDTLVTTQTGKFSSLQLKGIIVMWSGTIATIPSGWVLCNGSNGTPDLRNRFIVGADADVSSIAKSTVTGSALQTSNGQLPLTTPGVQWPSANGGTGSQKTTTDPFTKATTGQGDGSTNSNSIAFVSFGAGSLNVATFYALAYIQKT